MIRATAFYRTCQQKRLIDRLSQAEHCWDIAAKICDNDVVIDDNTLRTDPRSARGQGNVHDAIDKPKSRSALKENKRSMKGVANRERHPLLCMSFGAFCHDGSYKVRNRMRNELPLFE
jgi:hypothetical protein